MAPSGRADGRSRPGPLPSWLGAVLEPVYAAVVRWRNARFDRGVGVTRAGVGGRPRAVVSVGNLNVGGTGKTPMVMWLAWRLLERGIRPAIALRGYKGGRSGQDSDEAIEYRTALPGVPVLVGPDRAANIAALLASPDGQRLDCILLDDGFQHRRLHRDVDIVLIDATRSLFEDRLLPAGWLREPVTSLKRASAVVLTRYDPADPAHARLIDQITRAHGRPPLTAVSHWRDLEVADQRGVDAQATPPPNHPVSWLEGKRLVVVCGIGNPAAFLRQVKHAAHAISATDDDADRVQALFYPDHHAFPARSVREIVNTATAHRADAIVVTAKDWSKLSRVPLAQWPCPVVRPRLDLRVEPAETLLGAVLAAVADHPR